MKAALTPQILKYPIRREQKTKPRKTTIAAAPWDTISPSALDWCTEKIAPLYDFLQQENTKGFLVLKDGKIVIEKYFGSFTKDSLWYWASAGKTITAFLIGRAREDGYLSINQLTMTSGLDDGVPDNHCTLDTCLKFLADAGTRWAYHNAPYTLLEKVLVNATGQSINGFTQTQLKDHTGMNGIWFTVEYDNVYFSNVRSMARFGLLFPRFLRPACTGRHDCRFGKKWPDR
jgi:CubicO group peptidase (beta-lactamase class C family)